MIFFKKLDTVLRFSKTNSIPNEKEVYFTDIDFKNLKNNGIKYVCTDVDQTLVPQSHNKLDQNIVEKLNEIKNLFGKDAVCFLTNEPSKERNAALKAQTSIDVVNIQDSAKPCPEAFSHVKDYFKHNTGFKDIKPNEICFIGDRIWTDIVGANTYGMYSIQVNPYDKSSDRKSTAILRIFEDRIASHLTYFRFFFFIGAIFVLLRLLSYVFFKV
jgi:hypothetical protein